MAPRYLVRTPIKAPPHRASCLRLGVWQVVALPAASTTRSVCSTTLIALVHSQKKPGCELSGGWWADARRADHALLQEQGVRSEPLSEAYRAGCPPASRSE